MPVKILALAVWLSGPIEIEMKRNYIESSYYQKMSFDLMALLLRFIVMLSFNH